jgi:hypothetical protein
VTKSFLISRWRCHILHARKTNIVKRTMLTEKYQMKEATISREFLFDSDFGAKNTMLKTVFANKIKNPLVSILIHVSCNIIHTEVFEWKYVWKQTRHQESSIQRYSKEKTWLRRQWWSLMSCLFLSLRQSLSRYSRYRDLCDYSLDWLDWKTDWYECWFAWSNMQLIVFEVEYTTWWIVTNRLWKLSIVPCVEIWSVFLKDLTKISFVSQDQLDLHELCVRIWRDHMTRRSRFASKRTQMPWFFSKRVRVIDKLWKAEWIIVHSSRSSHIFKQAKT